MGKVMTTKKLKLRARAARRRQRLKFYPPTFNVEESVEMKNLDTLRSLSEKVAAVQAKEEE
jgi:hypothetical protein